MARKRIYPGKLAPSRGFSLIELLVVVAVIVILLALLLPAIGASRASSRAAECTSHLEQCGVALTKADLAKVAASPTQWLNKLLPYLDDGAKILRCPDDAAALATSGSASGGNIVTSYGINSRAGRMSGGDSHKIVMLDYKLAVANVVGPQGTDDWNSAHAPRHRGHINILQTDGSVHRKSVDQIDPRVCEIHDRLWRPTRDFHLPRTGCTADLALTPPPPPPTGPPPPPPPVPCPELTGGPLTISASAGVADEKNAGQTTSVTITITLSRAVSHEVTVMAQTADEAAVANQDFAPFSEQVSFAPGQTSKTITLTVLGDDTAEPNETFLLLLNDVKYNSKNCEEFTANGPATITIYDNDPPPSGQPDPCAEQGFPQDVDKSLNWIVNHQFAAGNWSLKHGLAPQCNNQCANSAPNYESQNGATGLALLALIGAGNAPGGPGPYTEEVCRGLNYLISVQNPATGDMTQISYSAGRIQYCHHIATLAMTEALLSMQDIENSACAGTSGATTCIDKDLLRQRAQLAIQFTVGMQGANGGYAYGYQENKVDLSVHMWAVASLTNAQKLGFNVPAATIQKLGQALDIVQSSPVTDYGITLGNYQYTVCCAGLWSTVTPSMTADGLFMRMMLGAPKNHSKIQSFINFGHTPWVGEPYYNLNVTHCLHKAGGQAWENWQQAMNTMLQAEMSRTGHQNGSYYWGSCPQEPRCAGEWNWTGGRLYCTVFSVLVQEKYFSRLNFSRPLP